MNRTRHLQAKWSRVLHPGKGLPGAARAPGIRAESLPAARYLPCASAFSAELPPAGAAIRDRVRVFLWSY